MNTFDPRLLRALLILLAERNVSRAAVRLDVSQSAMSQMLARLRLQFRDPLLLRSRTGMVPTDRAMELEPQVRRIVDEYDRLFAEQERFDPARSRRKFVLSAPEYAEHMLLPPLLSRLRKEAPHVRVEVRSPRPDRAYELLESGEIDLRIAWVLSPALSLRSIPLFQDRIVCIASSNHPEIHGELGIGQFISLPHVRPASGSRTTTVRVIDEALEGLGKKLEQPFNLQNFLTIPLIVASTDMLSTMPRALAIRFAAQHSLQLLTPPLRLPRVRYAAYWHERSHKDIGHRWLRTAISETARSAA
jgi:DNA-binding transcriptional LysR family regulator